MIKIVATILFVASSALAGILIAVPDTVWNELPPGKRNAVIQSCKEWTGEEDAVDTGDVTTGVWKVIHYHPGQTPNATQGKIASLQGILGPECTVTNTTDPVAVLYDIGAWPVNAETNSP
jgi:hypothetical protein